MQDTDISKIQRCRVKIYDTWDYEIVDSYIAYPHYEISFSKKKVYLDKDIKDEDIKKIILKSARDICLVNYGGGREDPYKEWLDKNAVIEIQQL